MWDSYCEHQTQAKTSYFSSLKIGFVDVCGHVSCPDCYSVQYFLQN